MNAIQVFQTPGDAAPQRHFSERGAAGATPAGGGHAPVLLKRSGQRPLGFNGRQIAGHTGYRVGTALWHELNLFETEDGRYVADIRVFAKAPGSTDQFHVSVADTLDEAMAVFEAHDARQDVSAEFDLDDPALAPAELMVHAAALRYRIAEASSQYRAVLANFLQQVEAA